MKTSHTTLVITILLIASFSSLTHGLILNGLLIRTLRVDGVLFCSADGNRIGNSPPVSGAIVQLQCAGSNNILAQGLTGRNGAFTLATGLLSSILFDPSTCFVRVNLPVATCSVLPQNGVLTAAINLVNIVQTVLGNIANFGIGRFVNSVL